MLKEGDYNYIASMFARLITYRRIVAGVRCFSNVDVPLTAKYYKVNRGDYSSVSPSVS